jgi:hypothetical protein
MRLAGPQLEVCTAQRRNGAERLADVLQGQDHLTLARRLPYLCHLHHPAHESIQKGL